MANSLKHNETSMRIGDTVSVTYKLKEGEKERTQVFTGIIIKLRGSDKQTKMFTVRKMSKSGIGVERIIPLDSPFIADIKVNKKTSGNKAKLYFIRDRSEQEIRHKIYRQK